jgi:hypothetical protein
MIEENLSRVDEFVIHSIHKLGLGYERCEDKGKIFTKFVPSSTYKYANKFHTLQTQSHPLTRRELKSKQSTNPAMPNLDGVYICMFCGCAGHLGEFSFQSV